MKLKDLIKSDLRRYTQTYKLRNQSYSKWKVFFESLFFKAGFQAVLLYRISHWLYKKKRIYLAWFLTRFNISFTGAEIEFNAEIGPGMLITHPVGIVIGRGTKIGSNVTIFQSVTFGVKSWHPDFIKKFPIVGNNCFFFAHSVILGDIKIGNNCVIAAQSVIAKNIPDDSLAIGVPAKVIKNKGKEMIQSWI